ncbi:TRM11 family methyltransferase [Paenibacillus sp. N3.4]|uniref:TRM11 family SAM-dependent methyltransferase n=1 Tax=Paenibacillus sp. N3.4 TaxID=2603222 RepID=UPI0011C83263|nr:RsmD family RNA methyltransferase [Paenibacillus sp. N3.4]TXK76080.1 RNA methyltransferase [Paenibacillus sp. N3.4]
MKYVYVYACHEDEQALCQLELRSLLGAGVVIGARHAVSARCVEPSRSPFLKLRLDVWLEAGSVEELASRVGELTVRGSTFKVVFAETDTAVSYDRQRDVERELGRHVRGKAQMRQPDQWFAVTELGGRWLFGDCSYGEAVWLQHQQKPQNYSTALGTRLARAVVNIAVPEIAGRRVIDPCCGIGTVLIEAISMGIDIVGNDMNPLAVRGARVNLDHFGMPNVVSHGDMRTLGAASEQGPESLASPEGGYDALILDMPYNLCSKLPEDEQLLMLQSARRLTKHRAVIITTEQIDPLIKQAGFRIAERCMVRKGNFRRQILVCE